MNTDNKMGLGVCPKGWRPALPQWGELLLTSLLVSACGSQAQPDPADQPVYDVVSGGGTLVCETYRFTKVTRQDSFRVAFSRFSAPDFGSTFRGEDDAEWILLRRVRDFLWKRDVNPVNWLPQTDAPQWNGTQQQVNRARDSFFSSFEVDVSQEGYRIGRFDIDNDGSTDVVLYRAGSGGSTLLVLNDDATDIDVERTERILHHPSRRDAGWSEVRPPWPYERAIRPQQLYPVADAYRGLEYGAFFFAGKTYVDLTWSDHPQYSLDDNRTHGPVQVFLTEGSRPTQVCAMKLRQR